MITLAIDCSASLCAVAVHHGGEDRIVAESSLEIGRGHAERLPAVLQSVLDEAGLDLSAIDRLGVTVGPGSFAGIRVGVAFARGLGLALGVPVAGVGTLEAIATPLARGLGHPAMVVLDARRGRVWALVASPDGAILADGAELTPAAAAGLAAKSDCKIIGSGSALLVAENPSLASRIADENAAPAIADIARIAAGLDPAANPPDPRYLREADAKPQAGFALPHEAV